jgi:hypothetical protein
MAAREDKHDLLWMLLVHLTQPSLALKPMPSLGLEFLSEKRVSAFCMQKGEGKKYSYLKEKSVIFISS